MSFPHSQQEMSQVSHGMALVTRTRKSQRSFRRDWWDLSCFLASGLAHPLHPLPQDKRASLTCLLFFISSATEYQKRVEVSRGS